MAKADDAISTSEQWMPFSAAVARAGSLEELLVPLREEHIVARGGTLLGGSPTGRAGYNIPGAWWAEDTARDIEPAAGRAVFMLNGGLEGAIFETVVIGIEIERGPVDKLWPVKPKSPGSKRAAKAKPQRRRVKPALKKRWPDGVPNDISTEAVRALVSEDLSADSKSRGLADPSWDTVNRALGRGKK